MELHVYRLKRDATPRLPDFMKELGLSEARCTHPETTRYASPNCAAYVFEPLVDIYTIEFNFPENEDGRKEKDKVLFKFKALKPDAEKV